MDEIDYILINAEEGGGFTASGVNEDSPFYLTDAETLEEVVRKSLAFARDRDLKEIRIQIDANLEAALDAE